jgi:hypothetical protein
MKNTEATTITEAAAVAEQGANVAPEQATAKGKASKTKGAPKGRKTASKPAARKDAKPAAAAKKVSKSAASKPAASKPAASKPAAEQVSKPATATAIPREFSKKAIILELLRRKDGASLAEIAKATEWQNHSIRGFISANLKKQMGLTVESSKNEAGERTYKIAK